MHTSSEISESVFFYGKAEQMPEQHVLRAGPLNLIYEKGAIRYIRLNDLEVIRMVYAAVRDHNWDTVDPAIKNENILNHGDSFSIEFDVEYQEKDIHFVSRYKITGSAEGRIVFEMTGEAISSFKRNRIGFCVLHPVTECAGRFCEVMTTDLKRITGTFPDLISAHQPFKDIRSMRWVLPGEISAQLEFEGDVFEMEDQRNWTDASFKTYCTPLELPFPVEVSKGTVVQQAVTLSLNIHPKQINSFTPDSVVRTFKIWKDQVSPMPAIGVGRSSVVFEMEAEDLHTLAQIPFHHYRTDIRFFQDDWLEELLTAYKEAKHLKAKLEIALHLPVKYPERELLAFVQRCTDLADSIYSFSIFQSGQKTTPVNLMEVVVPVLRDAFPSALIGAGTDAYFAELNRNRPDPSLPDFLTFSINPQVHAFDNASLIETLAAQADVVQNARRFSSGKRVHISPVTLKPRFNPNATGSIPGIPNFTAPPFDERQVSLFAAGWTLGSIKYLCEAGADSLTYYETIGRRGIFSGQTKNDDPDFKPPYQRFPLYWLFQKVLEYAEGEVLKSRSSKPLEFEGLVFRKNGRVRIMLANFLPKDSTIAIPFLKGQIQLQQVCAKHLYANDWSKALPAVTMNVDHLDNNIFMLGLKPFGLAVIDADDERNVNARVTVI